VTTQESSSIPLAHYLTGVQQAAVMSWVPSYFGVSMGTDVSDPWNKVGVFSRLVILTKIKLKNKKNNLHKYSSYTLKMEAKEGEKREANPITGLDRP
jgi:hypothetical protein